MPVTEETGPFFGPDGEARLADCALLFVDILGVRAMSRAADADQHLLRLQQTVRDRLRDYLGETAPWPAAFFSDTLVLASSAAESEIAAVDDLAFQAAWLQLGLIEEGLFLRGSLVLGPIHVGEILFGPALVEAYELESAHAVHPRVVLSERAAASQRAEGEARAALGSVLLRDDDGFAFVDYLSVLLAEPDDARPVIERHRDAVRRGLAEHRTRRRQWEKYRWVAEYHNAVVARAFPGQDDVLVPPEDATWRFSAFALSGAGGG
jgi:hypothetical protein